MHEHIDPATILAAPQKQIRDRRGNKIKGRHIQGIITMSGLKGYMHAQF